MTEKPWGGRFREPTDNLVETFGSSIADDHHIALDDVDGSIAHATMLSEVGLLTGDEGPAIVQGLREIRTEIAEGRFPWDATLEDVHMNVERRLAVLVGDELAGKLHTARSRNDQVALDARLYTRRMLGVVRDHAIELEEALVDQAEAHVDTLMPGYTHLQRAQPVRLAHHLLAYREMFARDRDRVQDVLRRLDRSPLGSGALAGTPHPIDRARVAELLGFSDVTRNSMDAVADRDFMLEAMSAASISMVHLSRLAEELIAWCSAEFGFARISDAFTTGSSMMPQKKNPDVAELVRGKTGRVVGDLVALLVTIKGLPLSYNRDLQEDKPPLYDALSTWSASVEIMARMIPAVSFDRARLAQALTDGFVTATELADFLVTRGVPFREAHAVVGRLVGDCIDRERRLDDLSGEELARFHPALDESARDWLDPAQAVERRDLVGGPARARVVAEIDRARRELAQARS